MPQPDPAQYEWRVVYIAPEQVGEMAPGTYEHPCRDRNHALNTYAYHASRATVACVRIERREFVEWQPFDIDAEAADG